MAQRRNKSSTVVLTTNDSNVKCVELTRSRHGFGFTLSGEKPSILTQVKGSAHWSGLRNGDFLMTVDDNDVCHMSHEDIVQLIQRTSGSLRLRCLQNGGYYSSNTDDSDVDVIAGHISGHSQHPNPNPVPQTHRHRNRHGLRHRKILSANKSNSKDNLSAILLTTDHNRVDVNHNSYNHIHYHNSRPQSQTSCRTKTNEPILDLLLEQKLSKIRSNLSESDSNNSYKTNSLNNNNNSYDRRHRLSSNDTNGVKQEVLQTTDPNSNLMLNPLDNNLNNEEMYSETSAEDLHSRALLRAIVGYLGTIEMPANSQINSNLIKACIRRIRVENKVQTIILLAVYQESIQLVNIKGRTIAQFSAENLKSCGICTDDQKYFAIITTNMSANSHEVESNSYSCHVFTTSASVHQTHYKTANSFGIKCTLDPVTTHCLEFPEFSDSILRVIVGLYRHKVGCAPSALANVNVGANSGSNSDSGINENIRCDPTGGHNSSYNTERLEAQLNPSNVRQTVHKYLKLKHDLNTRMAQNKPIYDTCPQTNGQNVGNELTDNDMTLTENIESDDHKSHKLSDLASMSASDESQSMASNSKTRCRKEWIMPATLSKENLELNNEITSGYDCDTKSSMSLEGMAPMSDTVSASASVVSERPIDVGWVGGWAQDFEKLLSDSVGLNAFAEFLKKEFSYENLQFWMSCEKYKKLTDELQLKIEAKNLFDRHLCTGAPEPVNVDGRVRLIVETGLENPNQHIFVSAEKQIYNLMKFDCYQRFLKSDIYKECVSLELQGKPLPYECDNEDIKSNDNFKANQLNTVKPKKRSFIPWHRIKSSKAEKQQLKQLNAKHTYVRKPDTGVHNSNRCEDRMIGNSLSANQSDLTSSQSSIASSEPMGKQNVMYLLSKSKESIDKSNTYPLIGHQCQNDKCHLSRVILPDHSQTVVPLVEGQRVGEMLKSVLQKRGLNYSAFDAFVTGSDKALDPNVDVSTLGCNEIRVEQRVLFEIDFPNREVIGIKARTSKTCGEVLVPLLSKYGYKLEHIILQIANSSETVTNDMPIIRLDNQRIIVSIKDDLEEWGWDCRSSRLPVAVDKKRAPTEDQNPLQTQNDSVFDKSDSFDNSPEKENRFPQTVDKNLTAIKCRRDVDSNVTENTVPLIDCNISFSDDTKSEAFFRDLMLSSQHIPIESNPYSLTPKLNATKMSAKAFVPNSQTNGLSVKPMAKLSTKSQINCNNKKELDLSECDLSPIPAISSIERLNSKPNLINDIDLDITLKSIQLYNKRNDRTLTPSAIPYPSSSLTFDVTAPNFTPPPPISSKHIALSSPNAPPLPPKAALRERGPPPRPPIALRHAVNHLMDSNNQNNNSFIRNIDQIIDSNISFV